MLASMGQGSLLVGTQSPAPGLRKIVFAAATLHRIFADP